MPALLWGGACIGLRRDQWTDRGTIRMSRTHLTVETRCAGVPLDGDFSPQVLRSLEG